MKTRVLLNFLFIVPALAWSNSKHYYSEFVCDELRNIAINIVNIHCNSESNEAFIENQCIDISQSKMDCELTSPLDKSSVYNLVFAGPK